MDNTDPKTLAHIHELAARIYVELVGRSSEATDDVAKLSLRAGDFAALSIQLAESFYSAEESLAEAKAPKKTFKLEDSNIAEWMK